MILAVAVGVIGVAVMAFAVQTADEAQSPVRHKVEIAHWLETGLWVNPHALLFGALIFLAGAVLYATIGSQSQTLRYVAISGSSLVLGAAITIFFIDAATRFPQ